MTALEVDGLDVPFGGEPGLRGITFAVERGERFVLVGASGSGKTSLLRALTGSLPPGAGRVRIDGQDVTRRPTETRPAVLLAQTPLLFPHLSVFENVAFPLRVRRVPPAEIQARVNEALASVRLPDFGERRPSTLSGGQARRVALARAVVARPPVLLLDEPLSALDPVLREDIRRTILELHADYRPALVMVTHDLVEAGRIADRIAVLVEGTLAQIGPPGEVFGRPASIAVARFLGLANEWQGVLHGDGTLVTGGVHMCWKGAAVLPAPGPVRVVFGIDGAEIVQSRGPELPGDRETAAGVLSGCVTRVVHLPDGATADVDTEAGPVEVRVSFDRAPEVGALVGVRLRPGRAHIYEGADPEPRNDPSPGVAEP